MASSKTNKKKAAPLLKSRNSHLIALEPRMMFDGAAVATTIGTYAPVDVMFDGGPLSKFLVDNGLLARAHDEQIQAKQDLFGSAAVGSATLPIEKGYGFSYGIEQEVDQADVPAADVSAVDNVFSDRGETIEF